MFISINLKDQQDFGSFAVLNLSLWVGGGELAVGGGELVVGVGASFLFFFSIFSFISSFFSSFIPPIFSLLDVNQAYIRQQI